jgi:hypothetical protein
MCLNLAAKLKKQYPGADIRYEKENNDVLVTTKTEQIHYEIKTDKDPKMVIRNALGQLLEYAFYWQRQTTKQVRLVMVGQNPLPQNSKNYINLLRQKFRLPLEYQCVSPHLKHATKA